MLQLNSAVEDHGMSKAKPTERLWPLSFIASLRKNKSTKANLKEQAQLQAARERDFYRANQKELAHRRQKVEEGLKLIGTPGWQEMLLQNTLEEDEDSSDVSARIDHAPRYLELDCFYDAPLDTSCDLETFFMPIAQDGTRRWSKVLGLLVQIINGSPDEIYYRRIGMFEVEAGELSKFRQTGEVRTILLI